MYSFLLRQFGERGFQPPGKGSKDGKPILQQGIAFFEDALITPVSKLVKNANTTFDIVYCLSLCAAFAGASFNSDADSDLRGRDDEETGEGDNVTQWYADE
jgi:hypothetical protein